MSATEIVAKEQVLIAVQRNANAELTSAIERKERMVPGTTAYEEMESDIISFRTNVIKKIQDAISALDAEKKSLAGISDFTWKH